MQEQIRSTDIPAVPHHQKMVDQQILVIPREEIDGISEMTVEGVKTYLGEVRNFKNREDLRELLPENLSISWTRLPSGEELPAHFHPCSSVIIVTRGHGNSTGDTVADIQAGDVVYIPEWNMHGFQGQGEEGFHALSIQFQPTAIFESSDQPETTYQQREEIPLEQRQLRITSRAELPSLHQVEVAGQMKNLGTLKNFAESPLLKEKFPKFFSAAWVHLAPGERLDTHVHDTDSMIILTDGDGYLEGDRQQAITAGDTVFVRAGGLHGFVGGRQGFWALSIQFQQTSLYQDPAQPQVKFQNSNQAKPVDAFTQLVQRNQTQALRLTKNPIFELTSEELAASPAMKQRLLDGLQVMSDHFQRLMYARMALCDQREYQAVFLEHFLDELGHDRDLRKERGKTDVLWDPILDASASWFVGKNVLVDNPGRVVMIQMVLEKGASVFYSHFAKLLQQDMESDHISKHCEADEGHDQLGVELLRDETPQKLQQLEELQSKSWDMLNLFLGRLAEIVRHPVH